MFKKGDYIVTLNAISTSQCSRNNFIFKQREDADGMQPCIDLDGSRTNGNGSHTFDKKFNLRDWRYATQKEIDEYERLGYPYDVTTLQIEPEDTSYLIEIFAKNNIT